MPVTTVTILHAQPTFVLHHKQISPMPKTSPANLTCAYAISCEFLIQTKTLQSCGWQNIHFNSIPQRKMLEAD